MRGESEGEGPEDEKEEEERPSSSQQREGGKREAEQEERGAKAPRLAKEEEERRRGQEERRDRREATESVAKKAKLCAADLERAPEAKVDGQRQRELGEAAWDELGLQEGDRPKREEGDVFVGGRRLHYSHRLWRRGSFTFCSECGGWCKERGLTLLQSCDAENARESGRPPLLKKSQREALSRLRKGQPPRRQQQDWM